MNWKLAKISNPKVDFSMQQGKGWRFFPCKKLGMNPWVSEVTSFFSPASRSGTPEELKYLVDTAHGDLVSFFFETAKKKGEVERC